MPSFTAGDGPSTQAPVTCRCAPQPADPHCQELQPSRGEKWTSHPSGRSWLPRDGHKGGLARGLLPGSTGNRKALLPRMLQEATGPGPDWVTKGPMVQVGVRTLLGLSG